MIANNGDYFPRNKDRFVFDDEVAMIFPSMAERSIPLYKEVHRLHASIAAEHLATCANASMIDIGCSRGGFIKAVNFEYGSRFLSKVKVLAVDSSPDMLDYFRFDDELVFVEKVLSDIESLPSFFKSRKFDVIAMFYVLQFVVDRGKYTEILRWASEALNPGGYLFIGHKEVPYCFLQTFAKQYRKLKILKGYSEAEINAKDKALEGVMVPVRRQYMMDVLNQCQFSEVHETTRWLQFATIMCRK